MKIVLINLSTKQVGHKANSVIDIEPGNQYHLAQNLHIGDADTY